MSEGMSYNGTPIAFSEVLPGNELKQSATLGHLLLNSTFFVQSHRRIKPDWFLNLYHRKIYQFLLNQYQSVGVFPKVAEFKTWHEFTKQDQADRTRLFSLIDKAMADSNHIRLEFIKPELTVWLHSKVLYDSMNRAAKHWNSKNFKEAAGCLEDAVKAYHEVKFEEGETVSFDNPANYIMEAMSAQTYALTTGLRLLDKALLDRETGGGMQLGDTTVVLAPSNTGKTSTLITIGRHNVVLGKKVLFMTHEGRPEDIRLKMLKCILGVSEQTLFDMFKTKEGMERINLASQILKAGMTYIPFNKAGMKVEDVVPVIRRAQEELAAKNNGKGFDLLISDYPAKLSTEQAARGNLSMRHVQDIVYEYYVQLALEYKFHSLLAIQTNRDGSRLNAGQFDGKDSEHRLLGMEDVAEAWGPMTSASNVITLNRSPQAKRANRMTLNVAKSRSSETGIAVVARTNFAASLTHSDEMGAVAYYGTSTMEDTIDTHLMNFKGGIIPPEIVAQDS